MRSRFTGATIAAETRTCGARSRLRSRCRPCAVRDRVNHLDEVRLGNSVREADPAGGRGARWLDGQHLDDRDAAVNERRRLGAPDQAAAEDDRHVRLRCLVGLERARAKLDVEPVLLEKLGEIGLPRGDDEYLAAGPLHDGMIPASSSFQSNRMQIEKLDHVALWVTEREGIADIAIERLGMHVIDRTDAFTLVGADARRGKLTLFEADGPRERGALAHVALCAGDRAGGRVEFADGLVVELVEGSAEVDYDLDHVALLSREPERTAARYLELGFSEAAPADGGIPRVEVGGAYVEFHEGDPGDPERPLLNHVAVLVESADEALAAARDRRLDVADIVDAANTKAVFVWAPERVKIEYVEHKPTFSLV
jgi:catechol 2,3-dioxygenase-like lactoylglutathione lyase family enzyme